jgi:hypothetical protein
MDGQLAEHPPERGVCASRDAPSVRSRTQIRLRCYFRANIQGGGRRVGSAATCYSPSDNVGVPRSNHRDLGVVAD